ncbi:hypothetical protein Q9L58_007719 [Maublancomyces gigas]|uniref:Uncharacterized protein n=1 Tax=Discina gigas TaxID=1032678 RepID=A0ABR3GC66_9PEZI
MAKRVTTRLPVLEEEAVVEQQDTFRLGMIFASKPLSLLTPEHGFLAELHTIPSHLPQRNLAGIAGNYADTPRFRRVERLENEKKAFFEHSQVKRVRCIIDESSDYSVATRSSVGVRSWLQDEEKDAWIARIGNIHLANTFLVGTQIMNLVIHGRIYCMEIWVVEELFPGHKKVDAQIVLGKDFLRLSPGLVLMPVFRGDAVDLIPWDSGYRGEDFVINGKGELVAYICGHEEEGPVGPRGRIGPSRGYFGIYFGPNSDYNMSMQCTGDNESPLSEAAVVEGAVCVVLTVLIGRMATWTSIRIRTDAQSVVNILNPNGILEEYESRNWATKKGKILNLHKAFKYWADTIRPELQAASFPWMKKDILVFEKVDKKTKGLQAARHLARSARDSSQFSTGDLGATVFENKHEWDGYLFTHVPSANRSLVRFRYPREAFIKNRKLASAKAPREESFTPSKIAQIFLAKFFPPEGIINIIPFAGALEKDQMFSALQILGLSGPAFTEEVLKIAKKKGILRDSVDLLSIDNGEFRFSNEPDEWGAEEVTIALGLGDYFA